MKFPALALVFASTSFALAAPVGAADPSPATADAAPAALTGPQVGEPAPAFALKTVDGKTVSLDSYRGKTLVINVWATWCPPCREEMPDLVKTVPELEKAGVAVLGVDTTEEAPIVRAYVVSKQVPYPQAIDPDDTFGHAYDVQYFPSTYVIDPNGILRARYIDVIAPAQLKGLVADATAGRNGKIVSPLQDKIDATLAAVKVSTDGDAAAIEASAKAADAAIASAEKMLDDSDASKGNPTDLLRTRSEESGLRAQAIAALESIGTAAADKSLLPRLQGDAAFNHEDWQKAIDAYTLALAADPKNEDALGNVAIAAGRLKQYDVEIDADTKLVALEPGDASSLVDLARAQNRAGKHPDSFATFTKAVAAAQAALDAKPDNAKALRTLAWTHLYFGRAYAASGDEFDARTEFETMLALTSKLPVTDVRHDMYLEEGQEAIAALGLSKPANGALVTLAPWTGIDLPGSIPNTVKYRLLVAGGAGRNVNLRAADLPKGWVASFCTDRVCAPFRTSIAIPESGVKIVEFQLVPPNAKAMLPKVRVIGTDGNHVSEGTT